MNAFICNNTTINNTVAGNNASFVNACFMNVRIADLYSNPTIIDYCCFTQNVCMNNCSVVNPEISGNISFSSLKNLNSLAQNLSQSFFSVSTLNTSMHLFNLEAWVNETISVCTSVRTSPARQILWEALPKKKKMFLWTSDMPTWHFKCFLRSKNNSENLF